MRRPRLLILSFSPIANDARVLKQVALFRDDYEVTTLGHGPAPEGVADHIEVPADLQVWRYSRPLLMARRYSRAYRANRSLEFAGQALHGRRHDVILANDADTVGLALELDPVAGVHADLHEYAPRQREDLLRWRLFVAPFQRWMCRTHVARADSWTTVGEGLAREYEREFGFRPEVVTNAAPYVAAEPTPVDRPVRIVHSGACLRGRSLLETIDGVIAASLDATLDLYLTPNDPAYLAELRVRAAASGGRVTVRDPVPYAELATTLRRYDLGIMVLPPSTFSYEWALPNKLFDYVQARLGIVIGPSPEMADYVERFGFGVVTDGFSPRAIATTLDKLDAERIAQFKRSAHEHARELSAQVQSTAWLRAVDALASRLR